jgi:hypothetical protein
MVGILESANRLNTQFQRTHIRNKAVVAAIRTYKSSLTHMYLGSNGFQTPPVTDLEAAMAATRSPNSIYMWQGVELKADPVAHAAVVTETRSLVRQILIETDHRFSPQTISLMNDLDVLDPTSAPLDESELDGYGDAELRRLFEHYSTPRTLEDGSQNEIPITCDYHELHLEWVALRILLRAARVDFEAKKAAGTVKRGDDAEAEFVASFYETILMDAPLHQFKDDILFLVSMLLGLATSSVCCETGFSKLNLVKTYLRNRLNVVNLDALLMIMCNGPNIRVQETSDEIQELCAAAYERWLRMCKRNPNRCIFGPRPRNKAKTAMQSTYDEPDDLFDPPEKVGDGSADVTETLAADDVAEDTDEAEPAEEAGAFNKLMRLAAVGPFKLAQSKRRVWEVAPKPTDAEFAAGLHVPEFKAGRDWRVAQRFEDKWHEGVLNPMRYGTLRVWWSLHYEVHYEDGYTYKHPLVAADYGQGMADNWVIIQKKIH